MKTPPSDGSAMKHAARRRWIAAGLLAVAAGSIIAVQRQIEIELRSEVELLRGSRQREVARLEAENRAFLSAMVPNAELEHLRADHAAVVHLRSEVDALKAREQVPAEQSRSESVALAIETPVDTMIPAHDWKNAGRATPAAAVQTALWAAAGGDLNTLAGMVNLNAEERAKVEAALAGLPEQIRTSLGTPERMMAMLVMKDLPLSSMQAMQIGAPLEEPGIPVNPDMALVQLKLQGADGATKSTKLTLRQGPAGWGFEVSSDVVEKYLRAVTGSSSIAVAQP
jgi:hypothetical protein